MKRNVFITLFLMLFLWLVPKLYAQVNFTGPELLGRPTNTSVTVNVVADAALMIYFEYDTEMGGGGDGYDYQTTTVSSAANAPIEVVISGLQANTCYYYRMCYSTNGGTTWIDRDEHSFHTQRAPGETFTFTIISDSHLHNSTKQDNEYRETLLNVDNDNPDFLLDLGDTYMTDFMTNQSQINSRYLDQRPYLALVGHSASIFAVSGNHDNEEGWNLDDSPSITLMNINARKLYYPMPIPDGFYIGNPDLLAAIAGDDDFREDYYAWEWGDALFVILDPYQYTMKKPYATGGSEFNDETIGDRWDWTLGLQQFNWFKQMLENSNATFKFVFAHHMLGGLVGQVEGYVRGGAMAAHMFEWGGYNADGTTWGFDTERPGWGGVPIHQFMVANNVSAFIHGHDHQYAYEMRDGIVYQSVPRPNTDMDFNYYHESDPYTIKTLPSPGHIRVTVSPSQAIVDYVVTSSGTVNYSYTIQAPTVNVAAKVFLEGPYDTENNEMTRSLNSGGPIPLTSPYNEDPRTVSSIPANVTDWVLVQLRSTADGSAVASKSAFLHKDGRIVADNGSTNEIKMTAPPEAYFIVIKHYNHLAIMSKNAISLSSSSSTLYDFTTGSDKYYGTGGAKELESGVWGLWSGDINQDKQITTSDYTLWYNSARAGDSGYQVTDINLDAQVTTSDYTIWYNNARAGASSKVP